TVKVQTDKEPKKIKENIRIPKFKKRIKKLSPVYEINIPHITTIKNPSFLHIKYSPAEILKAMDNIRKKSLFFTVALFIISIILIFIIISRFLKPIQTLKQSFDKIETGELNIDVKTNSNDEMGDLARAFNHMVHELRNNRERETILSRKERLTSLGQLAAGVAHEIKNPLNAIQLNLEHLSDKFLSDAGEKAQKYTTALKKEIQRLNNIVNNMLNFIRSENMNKKNTDINNLIQQITLLFEKELEQKKIILNTELSEKFNLNIDEERIKTAVMNIILNAIQAMPKGGNLNLSTNPADQTIIISDSGKGIAEKDLERIFDLFYTTRPSGTGMGLPTAYKIIKEHSGELKIESIPEKGTKVVISFKTEDKK
ncbi:MAG: HAMP domain-containing protein, partial [Calditrichia bacterium]|nr:HAMP domain-containing protein [Calditrichia bacterium]